MNDTPNNDQPTYLMLAKMRDRAKIAENQLATVTDERDALRDIFPRILIALQSGNCAADCSVDFLQMIPKEVELVRKRLQQELTAVTEQRDLLIEVLEVTLNATVLNHRRDRWHSDAEYALNKIKLNLK